jgi:hypothetical protein
MARQTEEQYRTSYSEMGTFKECRRKWYLSYLQGYKLQRADRSVARDTGILAHGAFEQYYKQLATDGAEDFAMDWLKAAISEDLGIASASGLDGEEMKKVQKAHATALVCVEDYFTWLSETGADQQYEFIGSEVEVEVPSGVEGVSILGIIDLLARNRETGNLVVMDHKFVASFEQMVQYLHIGEQAPQYAMLVRVHEGDKMRGDVEVVWNMIKRNMHTGKAKPPFYQRYSVHVNLPTIQQYWRQVSGQIKDMTHMEQILAGGGDPIMVAYPTPTMDCKWKCPFFQVCGQMNDPQSDASWTLETFYKKSDRVQPVSLPTLRDPSYNG